MLKADDLKVQLRPIGQGQAWFGTAHAVLWECYVDERRRQDNWQKELAVFWEAVAGDTRATKVFTLPRDPAFPQGYQDFLSQLGYAPDGETYGWWSKGL